MHILINKKYLTYKNYKVKCSIGKRGIGYKKKEGDLITPKGRYKIKYIYIEKIELKKFDLKLKTIRIRKNMGWCDDPNLRIIINLSNYHLPLVMKNFIKKKISTILF